MRPGPDRPDRRDRAGGQVPLCAARRDGDGRIDPADRGVDHVEEAGRGDRRPGARRQDRRRRVHGAARRLARAGPGDVRDRRGAGQADGRPDHPDGPAAGLRRRQRGRGGRVRRVPAGATGPDDLVEPVGRAGGRDGRHGRAGPTRSTRRGPSAGGRSPTARRSSGSGGWSRRRGAIRVPSTIPSLLPAPRRQGRPEGAGERVCPRAGRAADRPRDDAAGGGPGADGQPRSTTPSA